MMPWVVSGGGVCTWRYIRSKYICERGKAGVFIMSVSCKLCRFKGFVNAWIRGPAPQQRDIKERSEECEDRVGRGE